MTEHAPTETRPSQARAEKLRAIAAVFGNDVAARLGTLPEGAGPPASRASAQGEDRIAWQTNRLIQHLRDRVEKRQAEPRPSHPAEPRPPTPPAPARRAVPALGEGEDLSQEHPAVIAHMLRQESQATRVAVLRALPGQTAREVMRRLRAG